MMRPRHTSTSQPQTRRGGLHEGHVAITQHPTIERTIPEALDHLPLETLIRGKLVAVKPNDTWASAEDITAVTQPDTLRAVRRYLKRLGPRNLVFTGGAGAAETEAVFRLGGSWIWWRRRAPHSSMITSHPSWLWSWSTSLIPMCKAPGAR